MQLKYIELKGFKSFAQKERLFFEKRITAIVGPNGSGKSNIAEAFRFVLGEQSMKSMRSRRTEDLLFNGSKALPRTNRASVSLVFDNSDRQVEHSFDEVEIERVIFRDSSNEYYINGSPARLKDVTTLLSEAKIGTAGHHIISQGEADKLLTFNPRERKAYIEEALGLTQYKNKKSEAEKKLEKTEENLKSIYSLRRENAPHLLYLEREMSLIEEKRKLIKELEISSKNYAKRFIAFKDHREKYLTKEKAELSGSLRQTEEKLAQLRNSITPEVVSTFSLEVKKKIDEMGAELAVLREKKDTLSRSLGRLEAELEFEKKGSNIQKENSFDLDDALHRLTQIRVILERTYQLEEMNQVRRNIQEAISLTRSEKLEESEEEELKTPSVTIEKIKEVEEAVAEIVKKENALLQEKSELEESLRGQELQKERKERELDQIEHSKTTYQIKLKNVEREEGLLKEEAGRFFASLEEIALISGIYFNKEDLTATESGETLSKSEIQQMDREVERLKLKIESLEVGNELEVERAYREAKERAEFLDKEIADLEEAIKKLTLIIKDLSDRVEREFSLGLKNISDNFSIYFSQMFKGGEAKLSLTELPSRAEEETKETGVEVKVSLPHKNLRSTAMLSGGEKTLVSIALIFALSHVNPPPFLILDETDAALDEANSRRYGEALKELSKYSQLILITHNRETMTRAGMLYGVTMGRRAVSELLSIDLEEAEKIARQ